MYLCLYHHNITEYSVHWPYGHPAVQVAPSDSPTVSCQRILRAVFRRRGLSASPRCLVTIACRPTHPPFNHRRPNFSRCHVIPGGWGTLLLLNVTDCFGETYKNPSLQSFCPPNSRFNGRMVISSVLDPFIHFADRLILTTRSLSIADRDRLCRRVECFTTCVSGRVLQILVLLEKLWMFYCGCRRLNLPMTTWIQVDLKHTSHS